jgi:hypothetical protein
MVTAPYTCDITAAAVNMIPATNNLDQFLLIILNHFMKLSSRITQGHTPTDSSSVKIDPSNSSDQLFLNFLVVE